MTRVRNRNHCRDGKPDLQLSWRSDAGVTLIELLVVLGILALLAGMVAPQVIRYLGVAKSETTKTQINSLVSATEMYFLDNGSYPSKQAGLKALVEAPPEAKNWNGPYLKKSSSSLIDPWGRRYIYQQPGKHGAVDILSFGKDGQAGGTGEDSDIVSW